MRQLLALVTVVVTCAIAISSSGARVSASGPVPHLLWQGSVTPDLSAWTGLQSEPGDFAVVPAPGRTGTAAEFTVRPGDMPAGTAGERSELFKRTGEQEGVESFWQWSVYFPASFVSNPDSAWNVFTQWHQGSNTGVQPVSFEVSNSGGREWLRFRAWGGAPPDGSTHRAWLLAPLVRDRWYDFAFHVVWSPDSNGLVEVWLNGRRVVKPTHTPTLYRDDGVYLKQGFYRARSPYTTSILIAGTQRVNSFDWLTGRRSRGFADPDG